MQFKKLSLLLSSQLNKSFFLFTILKSKINFFIIKKNFIDIYAFSYNTSFILSFLKLNSFLRVDSLIDIAVVDFPKKTYRFKLIYNLLSTFYGSRLNLITFLKENSYQNSAKQVFKSADWLEREV